MLKIAEKQTQKQTEFQQINRGYQKVFQQDRMSIGVVAPLENYTSGPVPTMQRHLERVKLAETLGYASVWLRDVPFNVPSFGDAGQTFDPFVYLGSLAMQTSQIALGVASIVLPLRHPAHVAKAAATADVLSGGRLLLGVASGDRPEEYPALNLNYADRGERFRESFAYIRRMSESRPHFDNAYGSPGNGVDMLPKPVAGKLPLLITGGSQQNPEWIAQHGDGWMLYPRPAPLQQSIISDWQTRVAETGRGAQPVMEPLHIDLTADSNHKPQPIHLGHRMGMHYLKAYLQERHAIGLNHVALNLRFNQADPENTLKEIAEKILPEFHS